MRGSRLSFITLCLGLCTALAASAAFFQGCKTVDQLPPPACMCPARFHCDGSGACVADAVDAAVVDATMARCNPGCGGGAPYCNDNGHCVACLSDNQCPNGSVCHVIDAQSSACVPGCKDDSRCGDGGAALACCNAQCVNTGTDAANCGSCGNACKYPNGVSTCTAGKCTPGACQPGWGDCDGKPDNGCEANLHLDPMNCGKCGTACKIANAIVACSDGCYIRACQFGFDDCNGDPLDGCETPVLTDVKNCGGCGISCVGLPHARAACVNSTCAISGCDQGFAHCSKNPQDGCETVVATDANNCGGCGTVCPQGLICKNGGCTCPNCNFPNAKSKCLNNMCVLDACLPGFADCDGVAANGCEVNLNSDPNNCKTCGTKCPMNMQSCSMGVCVMGVDFGPMHSFTGLTTDHYITQGCCSSGPNCTNDQVADATYFCLHFYGQPLGMSCTPKPGYHLMQTPFANYPKMHKNGGCTGNGNNIPNTTCDNGPCKIGDWNESTNGLVNLVCHCM